MSNVVDISDKITAGQMQGKYLRLMGMVETSRKQIEADPWPVLDKAGAEIVRLRGLLDDIRYALSPMSQFMAENGAVACHNPTADMLVKLQAVRAIVDKV